VLSLGSIEVHGSSTGVLEPLARTGSPRAWTVREQKMRWNPLSTLGSLLLTFRAARAVFLFRHRPSALRLGCEFGLIPVAQIVLLLVLLINDLFVLCTAGEVPFASVRDWLLDLARLTLIVRGPSDGRK
jgi:hypothetical protein